MTHHLTLRFDAEGEYWSFDSADPGPAGAASALVGEMRISVDAGDPDRLVEIAVFAEPDGSVPAETLDLARELLGDDAARLLAERPGRPTSITLQDTPSLAAARRLAHLELSGAHLPRRPRLLDLPVVLQAHRLPAAHGGGIALQHALEVMPAVTRLAALTRRRPDLMPHLLRDGAVRSALRVHLSVLLDVLRAGRIGGGDPPTADLVEQLIAELRPPGEPPASQAEVDADFRRLASTLAGPPVRQKAGVASGLARVHPDLEPRLRGGDVSDSAKTLGPAIHLLEDGPVVVRHVARGRWTVDVLLGAGVLAEDVEGVEVRCVAPDGRALATAGLQVVRWPLARAELDLPVPLEVSLSVQLTAPAAPPASPDSLRRLTQVRALRQAQAAVAAALSGRNAMSAELWRSCAAELAGLPDEAGQRDQAAAHALALDAWPPVDLSAADWLSRLLAVLDAWAADSLAAGDLPPAERAAGLRALVEDLEELNPSSGVLARATEELGRLLVLHPALQEEDDEGLAVLRQSLQLHHARGDVDGADRVLGDL